MGVIDPVTEYLRDSLEFVPQPAGLYECPSGRFVGANSGALGQMGAIFASDPEVMAFVTRFQETGEGFGPEFLQALGFDVEQLMAVTEDSVTRLRTPSGWISASKMLTTATLSRPDLLLVTLTPLDQSEHAAAVAHERAKLMLHINEMADTTLRVLETALQQTQAAIRAQHELVREANARAAVLTRMLNDTPPGVSG